MVLDIGERKRKREEKRKKVLVLFIAAIMVLSVFGVVFYGFSGDRGEELDYNGFKFSIVDRLYRLKIGNGYADFNLHPSQVEEFETDKNAIDMLKTRSMAYYTSDFHDPFNSTIALMHYNLAPVLSRQNSLYLQPSYTTEVSENFPVITCSNATSTVPVIYAKKGDENKVEMDGYCIIITGTTPVNLAGLHENIAYRLLGVIE